MPHFRGRRAVAAPSPGRLRPGGPLQRLARRRPARPLFPSGRWWIGGGELGATLGSGWAAINKPHAMQVFSFGSRPGGGRVLTGIPGEVGLGGYQDAREGAPQIMNAFRREDGLKYHHYRCWR